MRRWRLFILASLLLCSIPRIVSTLPAAEGDSLEVPAIARGQKRATLSANMTGQIREFVAEEGQRVKEGAVLVQMDDRALALEAELYRLQSADKSAFELWQVEKALADEELKRLEPLRQKGVTTEVEYARAKAKADEADLHVQQEKMKLEQSQIYYRLKLAERDSAKVVAPFEGIVAKHLREPGESVEILTQLVELVNMDEIELEANLPEESVTWVTPGMTVELKFRVYPDRTFTGKVKRISPVVDPRSATFAVTIGAENPDLAIKPGLHATVAFRK